VRFCWAAAAAAADAGFDANGGGAIDGAGCCRAACFLSPAISTRTCTPQPPKRKPKTPKKEPNSTMASGPITVTLSESKREEFAELQVFFSSFLTSLSCSFRSLIPSDAFLGPIHAHSPAVGAREPRIFKTLFSFRLFCIRDE
jgi:hypothetical protein